MQGCPICTEETVMNPRFLMRCAAVLIWEVTYQRTPKQQSCWRGAAFRYSIHSKYPPSGQKTWRMRHGVTQWFKPSTAECRDAFEITTAFSKKPLGYFNGFFAFDVHIDLLRVLNKPKPTIPKRSPNSAGQASFAEDPTRWQRWCGSWVNNFSTTAANISTQTGAY